MKNKTFQVLFIVLMLATRLAMETMPTFGEEEPRYGGTLVTTAVGAEPKSLAPYDYLGIMDFIILNNIYDNLVRLDSQGNAIPSLAESWNISQDGLTYTFKLVRNAQFTDGVPVTSADVKFSMLEIQLPYNPISKTVLKAIDTVETPDNYTVVIKLKYRGAIDVLRGLGLWYGIGSVAPKHIFQGIAVDEARKLTPVGSGPFKFLEWVRGDHVTLVKNENYWKKDRPYVDKIVYKFIQDYSTFAAAIEAKELDFHPTYMGIDLKIASQLRNTTGIIVTEGYLPLVMPNNEGIGFNLRRSPTNDTRVRQAIAYALDRDYIVQYACQGFGSASYGPIPRSITWAYDPSVETRYPLNLTKAEELLDQAGYTKGADGIRLSISCSVGMTFFNDVKILEVVKEQLRRIGIDVTMEKLDMALLFDKVFTRKEFDMFIYGYGYGFDWQIAGRPIFDPRMLGGGSRNDPTGFNNSLANELFDLDEQEPDLQERKVYLYGIQKILMDELPFVWLWSYPYLWVIREGVHGLPDNTDPNGDVYENVWVDWAPTSEQPAAIPYEIIGAVIVVVIIIASVAIYYVRKSKTPKKK
jgi:peptide/nickel transport system substrate-binding protein